MAKRRVAVVMGGVSSEHEVSLNSGAMVAGNLNREAYEVLPIVIAKNGHWKFPGEAARTFVHALTRLVEWAPDCVFLALHGPFGEDGRLQGLLDLLGLPYVGSGCAASALAMDKIRCKAVVQQQGVPVAEQIVVERAEWDTRAEAVLARIEGELGFPCVMKSPCQGSSLGMAIPKTPDTFKRLVGEVMAFDDVMMIERYLQGTEVTCSVLDVEPGKAPRALPVTEICPRTAEFFDYRAKYEPGACEEITPARISEAVARHVQEIAVRVHTAVGCRGLSRSDMIIEGDRPVWIEVNTIPGMTQTSLFPQAAAAVGIAFPKLVELFVEMAIAEAANKGAR